MKNSACFIGNEKIKFTSDIWKKVDAAVYELIKNGVTRFIFGKSSDFGDLCLYTAGVYKINKPEIERIKFKISNEENSLFGFSSDYDKKVLLQFTDNSGKSEEFKRYIAMLYESEYCVFCFGDNPSDEMSDAYKYAIKRNKKIIKL